MKKIFLASTAFLALLALASCSPKSTTETVDTDSQTEALATSWLETFEYNTASSYTAESAHVVVELPKDINSSIRTHKVTVGKNAIRYGSVDVFYPSLRSRTSSYASAITEYIDENKETIKNAITSFDAEVQTSWSLSYNLNGNTNSQVVYVAYMPVKVRYFSTGEDTSIKLLTYALVPVKVVSCDYSIDETGKYTYTGEGATFITSTESSMYVNWTGKTDGSIA